MLGNINPEGKQTEVLALPPHGHTVVLGTAGSGKTTMALLRALGLSNMPNSPNVLVVTFNGALVQYMERILASHKRNLTIENFHKFARGYLNSRGKMPSYNGILSPQSKAQYIEKALQKVSALNPTESTLKRPCAVFLDEITFIQNFGFDSLENYVAAERIGRASANIKRENRRWFYEVFETYKGLRSDAGYMYDWDDLAYYAYHELLNDTDDRRYDHIIVDEGQDFSPMMIKTLTIAASKTGSFSFFGDVAQQIYGSRLSWRDSGIQVGENKIWRFDRNYRNPSNISAFAKDITNSDYWDSKEDLISPAENIAEGPAPVLIEFKNEISEIIWLVSQIKDSLDTMSNVIICRNRATIDLLRMKLSQKGVHATIIDKDQAGFASVKGVYLSTFHAAKGLEFENVFIPFLNEGAYPDSETINSSADQRSALASELKLLYVAVTRSKYGLFMSYHGQLSRLFPSTSSNYQIISGETML